jgi:hypothetical protein
VTLLEGSHHLAQRADPFSGASLLPMLVGGLVLIVVAMIAAAALS